MLKRIRFTIKTPKHKARATFAINKDVITGVARENSTVKDERIDAVNLAYKTGKSFDECLALIKEIQKDLYKLEEQRLPAVVHTMENLQLVERYFKHRYAKRINVRQSSKESMYNDLIRAISALGALSLYTVTEDRLQECVNKAFKGNKQRRVVMRLRQLLKFINRTEVQLHLDYEEDRRVRFAEMHEIDALIAFFGENRLMACLVAIGAKAGLRLGEIYALNQYCIKGTDRLYVSEQKLRDGTVRKPKYNKVREAFVIDDGMLFVKEWLLIPWAQREALRLDNTKIPRSIKKACRELFPEEELKHLNFHDTRHCYGVYLVSKGVSTDLVAKSMGNSPEVCRKHYQGFILSDTAIDTMRTALSH